MPEVQTSVARVRGIDKASQADLRKLVALAARLDMDPDHIAAVIAFESGWDPQARNPLSGATGLIQWLRSTAKHFGTTTDELYEMSTSEQLDYVEKYYRWHVDRLGRPLRTLSDVYMAVFSPKGIGQPPSTPLYAAPSAAYTQNAALDTSGDGVITVGEAAAPATRILAAAKNKPRVQITSSPSSPSSPSSLAPVLLFASFIVGIARWRHNARKA